MREIKFRGWDINVNHMLDWDDLMELNEKLPNSIFGDFINLMQYTGLKDKNGVYVCEGDIIKNTAGVVSKVVWDNLLAGFSTVSNPNDKWDDGVVINGDTYEIIGNIYENPDLMEVKDA